MEAREKWFNPAPYGDKVCIRCGKKYTPKARNQKYCTNCRREIDLGEKHAGRKDGK